MYTHMLVGDCFVTFFAICRIGICVDYNIVAFDVHYFYETRKHLLSSSLFDIYEFQH